MRTPGCLLLCLVACDLAESPETSSVESSIPLPNCEDDPALCTNSPGYLHGGLHEFSLLGTANTRGVKIAMSPDGFPILRHHGTDFRLRVSETGGISGVTASGAEIQGAAVAGADIPLVDRNGHAMFDLHIHRYRRTAYITPPTTEHEVYVITWHLPGAAADIRLNACNTYKWPQRYPFEGMLSDEVLLYTKDRIYPPSFTVEPNPAATAGWVTFGCAGHVLAKLDLSGNTRRRQSTNDWKARQATLKLYAADYCGDGGPFTQPGTPLVWRGPTTNYGGTPIDLEARWTYEGARCVHHPRLAVHPDPAFPDIVMMIKERCEEKFVDCTNLNLGEMDGATRVSANRLAY